MDLKEDQQKKDLQRIYRSSIFHCLVRRVGWILIFIGALLILILGGYITAESIVLDFSITFFLKIGALVAIGGVATLTVSLIKFQLFSFKQECYDERQRFKLYSESQS